VKQRLVNLLLWGLLKLTGKKYVEKPRTPLEIPPEVLAIYPQVLAFCREEAKNGMSSRWKHAAILTKMLRTGAKEKDINWAIEMAVREIG